MTALRAIVGGLAITLCNCRRRRYRRYQRFAKGPVSDALEANSRGNPVTGHGTVPDKLLIGPTRVARSVPGSARDKSGASGPAG